MMNTQTAPYPHALATLIEHLQYRPGFRIWLTDPDYDRGQGSKGLTLIVQASVPDSYHPERQITVNHLFPVPPAAYDERSWQRWLFDRLGEVETHERCEFFRIDGYRPYAPHHQPGADPYTIYEVGTWAEVDTDFRGKRNHPDSTSAEPDRPGGTNGVV
jgi:hypothetical protein